MLLSADDAFELLYAGHDISAIPVADCGEIAQHNASCQRFDKTAHIIPVLADPGRTPAEEHAARQSQWMIPEEFSSLDIRAFLLAKCSSEAQRVRVEDELAMFEARGLVPVLRLMAYLVDHFRRNGIVWGVGRGSSVASYCLYLLGVHKVDSMAFKLDIREFLR